MTRAFVEQQKSHERWCDPIPNLRWCGPSTFSKTDFFRFSGGGFLTRTLGGQNPEQLPKTWADREKVGYARLFVQVNLQGVVLLADPKFERDPEEPDGWLGKLWLGTFAFCLHEDYERMSKPGMFQCTLCKYSWLKEKL